jgi:uncharacterized protein
MPLSIPDEKNMYHEGSRKLQDQFQTRRLADRLAEVEARGVLLDEDKALIARCPMFFLATADEQGRPICAYKGGAPGFVFIGSDRELAFPDYNGNGTFRSLGNIQVNPHVALLFIDFERGERTLVEGLASVRSEDPLLSTWPGAQLVIRVQVERAFSCCPRYIHRMQLLELSVYVPSADHVPPIPAWKKKVKYHDVLPEKDLRAIKAEQERGGKGEG